MAELQQLQNVAIGSLGLRAVQLSQDSRLCLLRATARKNWTILVIHWGNTKAQTGQNATGTLPDYERIIVLQGAELVFDSWII